MRSTMNMPAFFVGQHDDDPRAEAVRVIHDPDPAEEYALTLTLSGCDVYLTLDAAREIAEKLSAAVATAERRAAA